jgi:hypothetical protein
MKHNHLNERIPQRIDFNVQYIIKHLLMVGNSQSCLSFLLIGIILNNRNIRIKGTDRLDQFECSKQLLVQLSL